MSKSPAFLSSPISDRLDQLHATWTAFARDPAARLLILIADDAETAFIEVFVSKECDADAASTPDLFLQLQAPYSGEGHGHRLACELAQHYGELMRSDHGVDGPRWQPPVFSEAEDDVERWLQLLASFRAHHLTPHADAKLVVWLDPSAVSSRDGYALWLQRATLAAPEQVRLMVVTASSRLARTLAHAHPRRVHTRGCALRPRPSSHSSC